MSKRTLLIIGCGDLGMRVGHSLAPQGWDICAVRRRPPSAEGDFNWIAADYARQGALAFAQQLRPDIVLTSFTPSSMDPEGYTRGFTQAAANVLDGLGSHRPRHLIMVSSTRVYAETEGGWIDENSPLSTQDERALAIIAAERLFLDSPRPASVVRFGGIYGDPHGRLLTRIAGGQVAPAIPLRYTNRIHRDDCAGFLVHLVRQSTAGAPLSPVYNGVDNDPAPAHEVESWIAARLDIATESMPAANPQLANHKRCRNARLAASGYALLYPDFRSGYEEVCRHLTN